MDHQSICEILDIDKHGVSIEEIKKRRDELLDVYSLYLATKIPTVKEEVLSKAYLLHLLDPNFSFVI